jgi:uncharacterized protein YegP (UPF0339 family)
VFEFNAGDTMWAFRFYRDTAGEYRWRLKGANGEIVGQGEGHPRLADAVRAAERFKANVGQARIARPRIPRKRPSGARKPERVPLLDALLADAERRYGNRPI